MVGLPAHHPPYHIYKHCSHSRTPAFAHASRPAFASAAVLMSSLRSLVHPSGFAALGPFRQKPLARFAWAPSRVTGHLLPVVEPTPTSRSKISNVNVPTPCGTFYLAASCSWCINLNYLYSRGFRILINTSCSPITHAGASTLIAAHALPFHRFLVA